MALSQRGIVAACTLFGATSLTRKNTGSCILAPNAVSASYTPVNLSLDATHTRKMMNTLMVKQHYEIHKGCET